MDINNIKILVNILDESKLQKLHVKTGEMEVTLEKGITTQVVNDSSSDTKESITTVKKEEKVLDKKITMVNAPLVGVYYQSSSPENESFVKLGDSVKKGETLCIIEAMKVMNEIKAPCDGKVMKIHINNGEMISYNQLLMEIGE